MGEAADNATAPPARTDLSAAKYVARRRLRAWTDKAARLAIGFGGVSVIIAILLIFVYLLSEVLPLFSGASVEPRAEYSVPVPNAGKTLLLSVEEQTEIALRLTDRGEALFFAAQSGELMQRTQVALPNGVDIASFAEGAVGGGKLAFGLSNGQVLLLKHDYKTSYPDDQRVITPVIEYPYGKEPLKLDTQNRPITQLAFRDDEDQSLFVGVNDQGKLTISRFEKQQNFLTGAVSVAREEIWAPQVSGDVRSVAIDTDQTWIYLQTGDNGLTVLRVRGDEAELHSQLQLTQSEPVTVMEFLLGGISLLVADAGGTITQWFLVRNDDVDGDGWALQPIRQFDAGGSVRELISEQRRKGFLAINDRGEVSIFNSTAERHLLTTALSAPQVNALAIAPRANALLFETAGGQIGVWSIDNEHPEVSWSALWQKVWYESYSEPEYIWQSSAANNDFEPKLSITPLAFGTLKAAFYAMLVAAPLAICGAIFTAHFMAPAMRRKVKPVIELMEALPTVILGFLAGLWLAPFIESHLPAVFSLLLLTPLVILLLSFLWFHLPRELRSKVPEGWYAAALIPVIVLVGWLCISASVPVEVAFFGGDMRNWLTNNLGVNYDQRNSLVVGIAMGFAVIPTIFSITEDAVFSVPKHLTNGSLALGATQWQTLMRVVLLTASPGIFSAMMIGFGRAVGETMIVLMATGNTAIMDWNIFEGMRTLAANIAVEMPESAVGSTHYRVLFLAAFVLFIFTFFVNTLAELVRQRLRRRYGSL